MKRKNIIIIGLAVLLIAVLVWQLESRNPTLPFPLIYTPFSPTPELASAPSNPISSTASRQLPGEPYTPADPRWKERTKRLKEDPSYEWKTPIQFYGKVVDQNNQPISGVEVEMNWTDLSEKGTSDATKVTNNDGEFSIVGINGKNFGITALKKDSYIPARASNQVSFEYAGFGEPTYYEPDANKPVIFHMRKKGEPAALIMSEGKSVVRIGEQSPIPMPNTSGAVEASPIKVTVFVSDGKARTWKAQINVEGGGIVPALQEFPYEAPKDGYKSSIMLDQDSPQPLGWPGIDEGGWFYIKSAQGYGLLELRQMKGKKTLHYRLSINPTGSTTLESAQLH